MEEKAYLGIFGIYASTRMEGPQKVNEFIHRFVGAGSIDDASTKLEDLVSLLEKEKDVKSL